jgi:hypothetical protein
MHARGGAGILCKARRLAMPDAVVIYGKDT